jgi:large subunit ribosomal protein L21
MVRAGLTAWAGNPYPERSMRVAQARQFLVPGGPREPAAGSSTVYAIVRSGGHQHKVAVGDTLMVDRLSNAPGDSITLPAVLLIDDGGAITSDAGQLSKTTVTAEVVEETKGPKISIHLFKNKTGYHRRQGHRARLTTLRVTGIEIGK